MAHQIEHPTAAHPDTAFRRPPVVVTALAAATLMLVAAPPAQAHDDSGDTAYRQASLTESTLALNQDLAREYAHGVRLLHSGSAQDNVRRWQTSAGVGPRNQAMVYPAGEGGVMVELNFKY